MQAVTHQQALADLVKQHQEVCGRLAAAATAEADMKQQMQRLDADRQNLQQQVEKVRDPPPRVPQQGFWGMGQTAAQDMWGNAAAATMLEAFECMRDRAGRVVFGPCRMIGRLGGCLAVLQLQCDVSCAAASALAMAQVQHEQQLIAAKQEQQEQLQEAKQQVEQLQQQLQELRQQQVRHTAQALTPA